MGCGEWTESTAHLLSPLQPEQISCSSFLVCTQCPTLALCLRHAYWLMPNTSQIVATLCFIRLLHMCSRCVMFHCWTFWHGPKMVHAHEAITASWGAGKTLSAVGWQRKSLMEAGRRNKVNSPELLVQLGLILSESIPADSTREKCFILGISTAICRRLYKVDHLYDCYGCSVIWWAISPAQEKTVPHRCCFWSWPQGKIYFSNL